MRRGPNAQPVPIPTPREFYQLTVGKGKETVTVLYPNAPIPKATFDRWGRGRYMPVGMTLTSDGRWKAPKRKTFQDVTDSKIRFAGAGKMVFTQG